MTVAVTGATGFIGRHVVAELVRLGISPVVVCRTQPHSPIRAHKLVQLDVNCPPEHCYELLSRPRTLIHLAWGGLPNYRSIRHFEEELSAQYRFLSGLISAGLEHVVIAGTCMEYGMQSGALGEQLQANPCTPYGFAKDALRQQLQYLAQVKPFKLTWARLFYMYGDGQAETSIFSQLRRAVERGAKSFDMSGGEQLRDYMPVEEVARNLVSLALIDESIGIVNVCSGAPVSVRSLVEGWTKRFGWSIALNLGHFPYTDYESMAFWGDSRKLAVCLSAKR